MMNVRRFQVLAGKHHAGNGMTYKQGDVFESIRPLDKLFVNKFAEVSTMVPVTREADPDGLPPEDYVPVSGADATEAVAQLQAKNKALAEELAVAQSRIAELLEQVADLEAELEAADEEGSQEDAPKAPEPKAKDAPKAKGKSRKAKKEDPLAEDF